MELAVAHQVAFAYSWGQTRKKSIAVISEIYKTKPDGSKEASELHEFIDKVKQNIDTAIFTINMEKKPLSEVADFLEIFVPEVKVPELFQCKSVALQMEKKTMKDIIDDLGLEISGTKKSSAIRTIDRNIQVT
jgi:uncharacterized membrane protein YgaE (UPF0421/DUF939 family)